MYVAWCPATILPKSLSALRWMESHRFEKPGHLTGDVAWGSAAGTLGHAEKVTMRAIMKP